MWGDSHEITAVELRPEIANIYRDFFPNDHVVVGDAHEYLQEHFAEFDFIWSSPPCQTHSKLRGLTCVGRWADKAGLFRCKAMARNYFFKNILQK